MYVRTESQFSGYLDLKLYYQRWVPQKIKGQLLVTHGHGEHSENYQRLVDALEGEGWSIIAWDWRGHGHSEGQRGFAQSFNDYCYDYESFFRFLEKNKILDFRLPVVALGHSMGGLIQLRTLASHPEWRFTGQVLSSPMLGVAIDIPPIKEVLGQTLKDFLPKLTLSTGIKDKMLTRDPEVIALYEHDVLRHTRMSSGVYFGSLEAMKYVYDRAGKFKAPILLQLPDKDEVVSTPASLKFFEQLVAPKTLHVYNTYKHEIYNDIGRDLPFKDLKIFLKKIST